jgi:hypothetical protein
MDINVCHQHREEKEEDSSGVNMRIRKLINLTVILPQQKIIIPSTTFSTDLIIIISAPY